MSRVQLLEAIRKIDLFGACMLALLAALALGAAYAALHFGWFSSPWQLAVWLFVLIAFATLGLPRQAGQQAGIAHGKFATRTDIDAYGIETDTTKPVEDQGIYLGTFQDAEHKWAAAELRYKGAKHLLCFGPTGFAETPPAMASADASAPTRVEFTVPARSLPPKPDDLPKGADPVMEMKSKAMQETLAKAVKTAGEIAAQYPKCRFRIASVAPEAPIPNDPTPPLPDAVTMRVMLLGDGGCLPPGK